MWSGCGLSCCLKFATLLNYVPVPQFVSSTYDDCIEHSKGFCRLPLESTPPPANCRMNIQMFRRYPSLDTDPLAGLCLSGNHPGPKPRGHTDSRKSEKAMKAAYHEGTIFMAFFVVTRHGGDQYLPAREKRTTGGYHG